VWREGRELGIGAVGAGVGIGRRRIRLAAQVLRVAGGIGQIWARLRSASARILSASVPALGTQLLRLRKVRLCCMR
jgi:hypothetical protein